MTNGTLSQRSVELTYPRGKGGRNQSKKKEDVQTSGGFS